jgi:hypothetical protein
MLFSITTGFSSDHPNILNTFSIEILTPFAFFNSHGKLRQKDEEME